MTQKKANPFPGGLLVLSPHGTIIEAPQFFIDALRLEDQPAMSVYHLFDDGRLPFLAFDRVLRRGNGIYEFYVTVIDDRDRPQGFRYWSVSPNQANRKHTPITFYIVDESSLLQSQEWKRRRQRREILNHVRLSLSQYIRTKLTSAQALTEMLKDNPNLALETADRLQDTLDELLLSLDDMITVSNIPWSEEAPMVSLTEAASLMSSWGEHREHIVAQAHNVPPHSLIQTEVLERIIQPVVQNALEANQFREPVEVDIWELGNGFARMDIKDHGEGMSEYVMEHAEDPFFTTKAGHLGLGLPQAYEALLSIGGQWKIESLPKQGTRVTLLIPVEEDMEALYKQVADVSDDSDFPDDELDDQDNAEALDDISSEISDGSEEEQSERV